MMQNEESANRVPEYLYHYTTVEALACILQSRSIRFSSLAHVDDLVEGQTAEGSVFASLVCVSSWTDEAEESIPFWREYAGLKNGVRIRLCTNPFERYTLTTEEKHEIKRKKLGINADADFLLPFSVLRSLDYSLMAINNELLHQVNYVDDDQLTRPRIAEYDGEETTIQFGKLGLHKREAWRYQQEWRYRVLVVPFGLNEIIADEAYAEAVSAKAQIRYSSLSPVRYVDLPLREDAIETMRVTRSPQLSPGNRIILDLLKQRFNPSMEINSSRLEGMIR
jgi:hypothetical protein